MCEYNSIKLHILMSIIYLLIISALCLFEYTKAVPGVVTTGTGCPVTRFLAFLTLSGLIACIGWIASICISSLQAWYNSSSLFKRSIKHSHNHLE